MSIQYIIYHFILSKMVKGRLYNVASKTGLKQNCMLFSDKYATQGPLIPLNTFYSLQVQKISL